MSATSHPGAGTVGRLRRWREPSDDDLGARAAGGDQAAFAEIFKRHSARLLAYCRHSLGDPEDAEDAVQQTFIGAHRALLANGPPRELRPWLYAIARNCCRDIHARRRPHLELSEGPALAGLGDAVYQREDLRALLLDLGRLPEQQRSALLLAELEGMPHRAIATVIGCSEPKVRALIYQARSALLADRQARDASCQDIREQLAVARGAQLRQAQLRRHLRGCPGCREFAHALKDQRSALALVLPVLPLTDLLGHVATHTATSAAATSGATAAAASAGAAAHGGAGSLAAASAPAVTISALAKTAAMLGVAAATAIAINAIPGPAPAAPGSAVGHSAQSAGAVLSAATLWPPGTASSTTGASGTPTTVAAGATSLAGARAPTAPVLSPASATGRFATRPLRLARRTARGVGHRRLPAVVVTVRRRRRVVHTTAASRTPTIVARRTPTTASTQTTAATTSATATTTASSAATTSSSTTPIRVVSRLGGSRTRRSR